MCSSFDNHFKIGISGNINSIVELIGIYELIKNVQFYFSPGCDMQKKFYFQRNL